MVNPEKGDSSVEAKVVGRRLNMLPKSPDKERQREFLKTVSFIAKREEQNRRQERGGWPQLTRLIATPAKNETPLPPDDASGCLTYEEKLAYIRAINDSITENVDAEEADLRRNIITSFEDRNTIKLYLKQWRLDFETKSGRPHTSSDFYDYVLGRANAFIEARLNDMMAARFRKFKKVTIEDEEKDDHVKKVTENVLKFLHKNQKKLLDYGNRETLFKEFCRIAEIKPEEIESAQQLWRDIIDDIETAFTNSERVRAHHKILADYADDDSVSDARFKELCDDADKNDPFLRQARGLEVTAGPQTLATGTSRAETLDSKPFGTIADVAKVAGMVPNGPQNPDGSWPLKYLVDAWGKLTVKMDIMPGSVPGLDHARYVLTVPNPETGGTKIDSNKQHLVSDSNTIFLNHVLSFVTKEKSVDQSQPMAHLSHAALENMARNFYRGNWNFDHLALPHQESLYFERLTNVLVNGAGNQWSFETGVKALRIALNKPDVAGKMYRKLATSPDSAKLNLAQLFDEIGYQSEDLEA